MHFKPCGKLCSGLTQVLYHHLPTSRAEEALCSSRLQAKAFQKRTNPAGWPEKIRCPTLIFHPSKMSLKPYTVCVFKGGEGKFLYIHSAIQREGDTAKVTTRSPFPASIGRCHLRFWFYMHGSDKMGTLKVISFDPSLHKYFTISHFVSGI